jgi:hypothetical protein
MKSQEFFVFKKSLFFLFLFLHFALKANIQFGHKNSGISVNGGTLTFLKATSNWNGTLDYETGAVGGSNLYFNQGVYQTANGAMQITGLVTPSGLTPITLNTGKKIIAEPGTLIGPLLILGTGNLLMGQPDLVGTTTLLNSFSELELNITNRLEKSILMNNGLVTLLNDLSLGDNTVFTGSGRVDLNYKTLRLPAKETTWTSQIYFQQANDLVLNAKTSLSGTWTFEGANAVLQGNGNILDLTSGGSLWIKSGAEVEFTDIHIRGLGHIYGSIIFEDATSRIRLSNATLQLGSNYTVTRGGIYIEGINSYIITGTSTLTIATGVSMTIDRVTCYADALDATSTVNVSPNIPDGLRLIYRNNGILKAAGGGGDGNLAIANSNAIVGWIRNTSNAVAGLLVDTSNAVVTARNLLNVTSNAVVTINTLNLANSNAIVTARNLLNVTSNAVVTINTLNLANSNAIDGLLVDTSNAVVTARNLLNVTSNAVVTINTLNLANSNAIVTARNLLNVTSNAVVTINTLNLANSNAIVTARNLLNVTSNAVVTINTLNLANSSAIVFANSLAVFNSNAIVGWIKNTSNAVAGLMVDMSNSIVAGGGNALAVDNSNAIVGWIRDTSNATVAINTLNLANSNAIVTARNLLNVTSNAVVTINTLNLANSNAIVTARNLLNVTSNAVVTINALNLANSSAVVFANSLAVFNSNAIVSLGVNQLVIDNSNAIVGWIKDTSNAVAGLMVDMSNAIVADHAITVGNSNALVSWVAGTSQAVANFVLANSQAIVTIETLNLANSYAIVSTNALAVNNSWAVVSVHELAVATSNALLANQTLDIETSNAVVAVDILARANSAAIVGWIRDTSNAVAGLLVATSQAASSARGEADRANNSLLTVDHGPAHIHMSGAMTLSFDTYVSPDHQLRIHASGVFDGAGHAMKLGRSGIAIDIDPAVTVTLQNVVLKDFVDTSINVGAGSAVYFGQNAVLELGAGQSVTRTWTFAGYGSIKGNAENLSLGNGQNYIVVLPNAGLTLKDVYLSNVRDNNIRCMGDAASLTLENAWLQLASDYTFSAGSIAMASDVHISGTSSFNYTTRMGSTVQSGARLNLEMGSTLNYAPSIASKNLLILADSSSQMRMTGATLVASTTGCQLTKGKLIVDGLNYIESAATVLAEGVVFGDGTPANDLLVEILPGAGLTVSSGFLYYNNAN